MEQPLLERQEKMAKAAVSLGVVGVLLGLGIINRPALAVTALLFLAAVIASVAAVILGFLAATGPARVTTTSLRVQALLGMSLGVLYPLFVVAWRLR